MDKISIRELFATIDEDLSSEVIKKEKYKEAKNREYTKKAMLKSCLSEENLTLVEEYSEIKSELATIEIEEAFVKGFSIAYQLLIDSLR